MENKLTTYHTSLEKTTDVVETMKWKLENIKAEGKDIENSVADYVFLTMDNLSNKEEYLKNLIKEAKTALKDVQTQKDKVSHGVAEFMADFGADKLSGVMCSSISVTKGKESCTKEVFESKLSKKDTEQLIIDSGFGYMKEVTTPGTKDAIRVNHRKIALSEVVENENNH